ncbi:MAG: hypothetical protein H7246_07790 [Phycisphaerae bacterium]|nr:hypothetical protein [Saprospiraceae bacterium]
MKKSLILTLVFAAISFGIASAQNITRPTESSKSKPEQKTEKSTHARPGSQAPTTQPSGQTDVKKGKKGEKGTKGEKGKHKGHDKPHKGKGKAKGHKKGQHDKDAKGKKGDYDKDHTKRKDKSGRIPIDAAKNAKTQKQGDKN